jgi:multiple antibiotic resistance protein
MTLGPFEMFILFFVTLGPLKLIGPFVHETSAADAKTVSQIAIRAFVLATICVFAAGFGGSIVLAKWQVSLPAMTLAGGLIFFLVALRQVLEPYQSHPPSPPAAITSPMVTAAKLAFPLIAPPYGIAAVIVVFAAAHSGTRVELIVALLLIVMVLNLLTMLYARALLHGAAALVLRVIGAVLGVLQVALAVQIMIFALRELGAPLR